MWQALIDTLDKLGATYDDLATLGEKKYSALVNVDMKNFSVLLNEEKAIIAKINELEQNRLELFKDSPTISAEDFYKSAPAPIAEKLFKLHGRLVENVQRALKLRDDNQVLAQCALDSAQMKLNKIGGATIEPTYSGKGAGVVTHQKNFDFMA